MRCFDGGAPRRPSVAIRIGWLLTLVYRSIRLVLTSKISHLNNMVGKFQFRNRNSNYET